ncbi:hypothetical protein O181_003917 [Austropuccinia psidii MF-1]|uniref:Uncharacterized protein n=1 Tax=Austropuccinia psidii MF-1 TaxID=1389203 RepID=A0A9Q3GFA8_9BASI|nr:hypothetical protein [Austropuccinia psidii MF-1]
MDKLASHPSIIYFLQDLIDVTLDLDTRYHERQEEKNHSQENATEASKSSSSNPRNFSRSRHKKKKVSIFHYSFLNKDQKLIASEKERCKEGLSAYCGGKHSIEACVKRPQNQKADFPSREHPE